MREPNDNPSKPGPRTEAGKARSSMNALRHGLSGRVVVLPTEDLNIYLKFSKDFVAGLNPQTPTENELAQNIADGYWRLKRVRTTEDSLFALGHDEEPGDFDTETASVAYSLGRTFRDYSQDFVNLSIYEQRIQRGIERNTNLLRELQTERKVSAKAALQETLRLRGLNKSKSLPCNPQDGEFVCSTEQPAQEANPRDPLRETTKTLATDQKAA
jgi:hypothetical protein